MVNTLIKSGRKQCLFIPNESSHVVDIGRTDIERILPHRDPFLLIDSIDRIDLQDKTIRGSRLIDPNDPVFKGHFPGQPVYPGVLLLEIICQMGACLFYFLQKKSPAIDTNDSPRNMRLIKIVEAHFLGEVCPGDTVIIVFKSLEDGDYTSFGIGQIIFQDQIKAVASCEVYWLVEPDNKMVYE